MKSDEVLKYIYIYNAVYSLLDLVAKIMMTESPSFSGWTGTMDQWTNGPTFPQSGDPRPIFLVLG